MPKSFNLTPEERAEITPYPPRVKLLVIESERKKALNAQLEDHWSWPVYRKARHRRQVERAVSHKSSRLHWEDWETRVYIYQGHRNALVRVPMELIRHLGLKHKQTVTVAIKKLGTKP